MAHNITDRDGMFTVREPAWHFAETQHAVLPDYPTREEAQAIALPWEPETEPLYRGVPEIDPETSLPVMRYVPVEEAEAVVRSDTQEVLGVKPPERPLVTNDELFDIAEALEGNDADVKYETGGSLKGGRKVWLLLRLNEPLMIPGDNGGSIPYFGLQNAHDGSGALRGQSTVVKIVCDNTSQVADLDARARGTEFVFRHTKNMHDRIEEAKNALAGWRESISAFQEIAHDLISLTVTKEQRETFVTEFIPMPIQTQISDRVVENIEEARRQVRTILAGPTCDGIDLTAWGLVQAGIEFNQHYRRARSAETRFSRAYLDRSRVTAEAVDLARLVASV